MCSSTLHNHKFIILRKVGHELEMILSVSSCVCVCARVHFYYVHIICKWHMAIAKESIEAKQTNNIRNITNLRYLFPDKKFQLNRKTFCFSS